MSITDELRKWAHEHLYNSGIRRDLLAIADRIDAEYEEAITSVMNDALYHANDENMAELGWVRLPKDADGVPISVGDVLTDDAEFKSEGKVMRLMLEYEGWMVGFGCGGWTNPSIHEWHHHHAPTVEDVLTEVLYKAHIYDEQEMELLPDLIAEYAKRLRLANDDE